MIIRELAWIENSDRLHSNNPITNGCVLLVCFDPHRNLDTDGMQEYTWSGFKNWVEILEVDSNRFTSMYYYAEIIQFLVNNKSASVWNIFRIVLDLAFYLFENISDIDIASLLPVFFKEKRKQYKYRFRSLSNLIEYLIIVSILIKKFESGNEIHSNAIHKWNALWNLDQIQLIQIELLIEYKWNSSVSVLMEGTWKFCFGSNIYTIIFKEWELFSIYVYVKF